LIYERRDLAAVEPLRRLARDSVSPLGRMHALYTLSGLESLTADDLLSAIDDSHPRVREHAVRLSEAVADDRPPLAQRLYALVADDDPGVRYQLAFTLGELTGAARDEALAALARGDAGDPWLRLAVLSSLNRGGDVVFTRLMADAKFRATSPGNAFLMELARQIGARGQVHELATVLHSLEKLSTDESKVSGDIVRALSEGGRAAGHALPVDGLADGAKAAFDGLISDLLAAARRTALDSAAAVPRRVEAIATLKLGSFDPSDGLWTELLYPRQPHEVQAAALRTVTHFADDGIASLVFSSWSGLSPRLRVEAEEVLFARSERLASLLDAVEQGKIAAGDFSPARIQSLTGHPDAAISRRARELFREVKLGRRADVVAAYRKALHLSGDRNRGEATFNKVCATCHRVADVGHEIGPSLAAMKNRGDEAILAGVLDPNQEVNPQYVNYAVITKDGRSLSGIIVAETATSVTLKRAEGVTDTVLRVNIDEIAGTGLSIMPEGMEKELSQQAMADLIAYIMSLE
jgi:putative heme-binding domain-containing protein